MDIAIEIFFQHPKGRSFTHFQLVFVSHVLQILNFDDEVFIPEMRFDEIIRFPDLMRATELEIFLLEPALAQGQILHFHVPAMLVFHPQLNKQTHLH